MAHWRQVLPARVLLDVRYEDVVLDLEGQARRMLTHAAWSGTRPASPSMKPIGRCGHPA